MMTTDDGSVTRWIRQIEQGDPVAQQKVWERYSTRLANLASDLLRRTRTPGSTADGEDVVLDAFNSFYRGAARGRFPRLEDRDDLWQILVVLAERRALTLAEYHRRHKRDDGRVTREADMPVEIGLDGLAAPDPSPEMVAEAAEACRGLMNALGDEELKQIVLWKFEGYSHEEIRVRLGCALRTVTNKVELIRRIWRSGERDG